MSGGGSQAQNPAVSSQALTQALQQYPQVNNPTGGANPGGLWQLLRPILKRELPQAPIVCRRSCRRYPVRAAPSNARA